MYAAVPLAALVGWFIAESSHSYVITRSCFAAPQAVAASSPHTQQSAKALQVEEPHAALADGCRYVFLDLGGNLGMQTRKLFEPSRVAGCGGAGTHDGRRTLPELLQAYRSMDTVSGANAKSICYKTVFDLAFGTEVRREQPTGERQQTPTNHLVGSLPPDCSHHIAKWVYIPQRARV